MEEGKLLSLLSLKVLGCEWRREALVKIPQQGVCIFMTACDNKRGDRTQKRGQNSVHSRQKYKLSAVSSAVSPGGCIHQNKEIRMA